MKPEIGTVFPPRDEWDIAAYDTDECVAGYRSFMDSSGMWPGANNSPAFRWGWMNARADFTQVDDGFNNMRSRYIHMIKTMN